MTGPNVGDLLNSKGITWGWFEGGFKPSSVNGTTAVCATAHTNIAGTVTDYIPHHEPFQYYASTSNPHHKPPSSVSMIGKTDQANHQYDLSDFWAAVNSGHMPAVSFLKAAAYQDGQAGYSDPLDEQTFLVDTLNALQKRPEWRDTAVVIAYDDSDGWYDHVMGPIVSPSESAEDALTGMGSCGTPSGRCIPGPLWLWPTPATTGHFALCQAQLRRSCGDRSDLDPALHRGQLESGEDRRPVI